MCCLTFDEVAGDPQYQPSNSNIKVRFTRFVYVMRAEMANPWQKQDPSNLLKTVNQSMLGFQLDLFGGRAWEHVYINVLCHVDVQGPGW